MFHVNALLCWGEVVFSFLLYLLFPPDIIRVLKQEPSQTSYNGL